MNISDDGYSSISDFIGCQSYKDDNFILEFNKDLIIVKKGNNVTFTFNNGLKEARDYLEIDCTFFFKWNDKIKDLLIKKTLNLLNYEDLEENEQTYAEYLTYDKNNIIKIKK